MLIPLTRPESGILVLRKLMETNLPLSTKWGSCCFQTGLSGVSEGQAKHRLQSKAQSCPASTPLLQVWLVLLRLSQIRETNQMKT